MAGEDRWERWSAATGILFVALVTVLSLLGAETPQSPTPESLADFYREQGGVAIGFQYFLVGLAGAALLWFTATLRAVLRRAEGEPGRLSAVAFGGGGAAAVLLLVAGSLFISPGATVIFDERVALDPVLDSVVAGAGFFALNFGLMASAVMFTATGLVALRTGVLPTWYAWAGFVVSLALLVNIFYFFGFFVWLAWILVTSILLMVRSGMSAPRTSRARARHRG